MKMTVKKWIGSGTKLIIAAVVFAFLGMRSLDFFTFATPADQWYFAWLGFGLTGGGVLAYLLIFQWDADTELKKTVAIVMLAVCIVGELATAGFGLKIDAWEKAGIVMTETDFESMILAVQLLGFAHAVALIAYVAGDAIVKAFQDDDKDGTPNFLDPDYKRNKHQQNQQNQNRGNQQNQPRFVPNQFEVEIAKLQEDNARLKAELEAAPKDKGQK